MHIITIHALKNANLGIAEIPKNASTLFHQINIYRTERAFKTKEMKYIDLSTFLLTANKRASLHRSGIDSRELRVSGFTKRNKFTVVVYLRNPYKRFISALYEELVHGEIEHEIWKKINPNRQFLIMKILEENFANLDFNSIDHTVLQSTLIDLNHKYCNYDFFYNPESLGVIVEKYNICKADELRPVNETAKNEIKSYFVNWMHETGILEKNKDIIYKYLKPDYDLLNFIKTKWGFSYGRYN